MAPVAAWVAAAAVAVVLVTATGPSGAAAQRTVVPFDFAWRFHMGPVNGTTWTCPSGFPNTSYR